MGWVFLGLNLVSVFVGHIRIACSLWGVGVPHTAKTSFWRMLLCHLLVMISDAKKCNCERENVLLFGAVGFAGEHRRVACKEGTGKDRRLHSAVTRRVSEEGHTH